jgi:hypothetical protein
MMKILISVIACLALLGLAGCAADIADNLDQGAETAAIEPILPIATLAPAAAPTADEYILSAQPYTSASGAYEIFFPQGWNCSESGPYRVDCQSPDSTAVMNIRLIHTGEHLTQPEFLNLAEAEINFTHAGKRAFNEDDRLIGNGVLTALTSWMEGESAWMGEDYFARSESVVYCLSFSAVQEEWVEYESLVDQVKENISFDPAAISKDPMYGSTFEYTAPDSLFTIDVPTSWMKRLDVNKIPDGQVEIFTSPDMHASIQVVLYRHDSLIDLDLKTNKVLEIQHSLYGKDYDHTHYKALSDGRERLAWILKERGVTGISFFDSWGGSLYIFTVLWDDAYHDLYQPVLDRVVESFGYP